MPSIHAVTVGSTTYDIEGNIKIIPLYYTPNITSDRYEVEYNLGAFAAYKLYKEFSTSTGPNTPLTEIESNVCYRISECISLGNGWVKNSVNSFILMSNNNNLFPLDYTRSTFDPVRSNFATVSSSDSTVIAVHPGENSPEVTSNAYIIKRNYSIIPQRYEVYVSGDTFDTSNVEFLNDLHSNPGKFNFYLDLDYELIRLSGIYVDDDLNAWLTFDNSYNYKYYKFQIDSSGKLFFDREYDYYPETTNIYVDGTILYM